MSTAYRLQSIRKTTIAFASLFKDIPLIKYNNQGQEVERIIVPIIYGDKEKYVKRLDIEHEKVQITLPRIEYGLTTMEYDSSRKLNSVNKLMGCSAVGDMYVNSPIPYNFNLELVLYTRNIEDANQIMEYILSHFTPDYNLKIVMVPEAGIIKNIPITFNGDSEEEDSTGSYDSPVRSVFRTLTFTARSYIFQPPLQYKPILQANTVIYVPSAVSDFILNSGNGTFSQGESVFQGYAYDRSTARGVVDTWNPNTQVLRLTNLSGVFIANSIISNISGSAQYIIGSLPNNGLAYDTGVNPTPNTYPVTGPYTVNQTNLDYTV